ncbi:MAG: hypothetical protein ABJO88_11060 [Parasphingorhabdus sp.]
MRDIEGPSPRRIACKRQVIPKPTSPYDASDDESMWLSPAFMTQADIIAMGWKFPYSLRSLCGLEFNRGVNFPHRSKIQMKFLSMTEIIRGLCGC